MSSSLLSVSIPPPPPSVLVMSLSICVRDASLSRLSPLIIASTTPHHRETPQDQIQLVKNLPVGEIVAASTLQLLQLFIKHEVQLLWFFLAALLLLHKQCPCLEIYFCTNSAIPGI